jgi:hypothetical protein
MQLFLLLLRNGDLDDYIMIGGKNLKGGMKNENKRYDDKESDYRGQ